MLTKNENNESIFVVAIVLLLLVYSFFGYLLPDYITYLTLPLVSLAIILNMIIETKRIITTKQFVLFCLIILFITIQTLPAAYSIFPGNSINTSISRSTVLFIGILLSLQGKWHKSGLKWLFVFSLIHVLATLTSYMFPSVFQSTILTLLPADVANETIIFMSKNAYSGITDQTGRNAFYISVGISVLLSTLIIKSQNYRKLQDVFLIMTLVFFLLALLLTGKRGHLISSLFSMLFVTGVYTKVRGKSFILKLLVYIVTIIALLYLLTYLFPEAAAPFLRFLEREGGDQTSGRIELYIYALEMFKEKPILGWGIGVFNNLYDMGSHNVYLQLLSEHGLLGFISFTTIILFNLSNTIISLKRAFNLRKQDYIKFLLGSLYIQIFFLVYGMTGNPLNDGFILIIYLLAASIPYTLKLKKELIIA